MPSRDAPLPFLRLVEATSAQPTPRKHSVEATAIGQQVRLFSDSDVQTLGFVEASEMDADTFVRLITDVKPTYLFDLRQVPIFSRGNLPRRSAFAIFESVATRYFDVAGFLETKSPRDTSLNPKLLVPNILQNLIKSERGLDGPILFFVDREQISEDYILGIAAELPNKLGLGWSISVWDSEHAADLPNGRDIVFISHANPEDNHIALWLASRLAARGYKVWSDITRLVGGEVFWDSIEDVIRNRAGAVVVLLSRKGHQKPGLLDEVNLAVAVERKLAIDSFVIPVRIDGLPFSAVRANIARKNVIDGSADLSLALNQVIETLERNNIVPEVQNESAEYEGRIATSQFAPRNIADPAQWDVLFSNKLKIDSWPKILRRVRVTSNNPAYLSNAGIISAPGPSGIYCFAESSELSQSREPAIIVSKAGEALTGDVLKGNTGKIFGVEDREIHRTIAALVRGALESDCRRKGLNRYTLSGERACWFFAHEYLPGNKGAFIDAEGSTRKRALSGFSKKRNVYWHFGVEFAPAVADQSVRLRPHVIFSEDGKTPIASASRQHTLRRGFCKSWWNARWRDLLSAAVAHLGGVDEFWDVPVSPSQHLRLANRLTTHTTLVSVDGGDRIGLLKEPGVEVGFGQILQNPREGLLLFGPLNERNPSEIRVGVIGTREGIDLFKGWCKKFKQSSGLLPSQRVNNEIPFPGFGAVFGSKWREESVPSIVVSRADLINSIRGMDRHQAVFGAVSMFVRGIERASTEDDLAVDVWFVVIPDEVHRYGRPQSKVPRTISIAPAVAMNKHIAKRFGDASPSLFPEDNEGARIYNHQADFHHQLKARLLRLRATTQILRESSIEQMLLERHEQDQNTDEFETDADPDEEVEGTESADTVRQMQPASDVAWNLAVASYFKAGGRPWKVSTARPGVCYIGLIFKRDEQTNSNHACCGAQLFLDSGEGLIFKGTPGRYYSSETKQFHLTEDAASDLLEAVLTEYKKIHKIFPTEVFVHGRTRFNSDELRGFESASQGKSIVTGVRITRSNEYKLYSSGEMPVRRGTYQILGGRRALLWTSGFIEALGTYQGRETPNPLLVEICGQSDASIETVLADIMTLTKMNFNSSVFSDGYPVTMRFADAIGDVLAATGEEKIPPLPFRHYI